MPGDYTRFTFSPVRDYVSVLMQQGRVQLDADWNEFAEILDRRWRAETIDVMGRAVVPRETPDGFRITVANGKLMIGAGRIYVDGILAENHGISPAGFDPVLAELAAGKATPFDHQPYICSGSVQLPQPPYLVYLDVWEREVTVSEEPSLIEKAVGVDTTTRRQAAWQVKTLAGIGNVNCPGPQQDVPGWEDTIAPSPARLTASTVQVNAPDDPCRIPPGAGYRGMENQLYRVEIHDSGKAGHATFKWSRDNASAAAAVTNIRASATDSDLFLSTAGRDPSLAFSVGDWVEITDDCLELSGQPGLMFRVSNVDDALRTITVVGSVPAQKFPTSGNDKHTDPVRHTRVRRWEQRGPVYDVAGNKIADVEQSGGVIRVPDPNTSVLLESGIQVTFSTDPADSKFRVGDYWVFAARTADGNIEKLTDAPPRGLHHHYCALAVVPAAGPPSDCRTLWPPATAAGCECTVCVSAESHNSGQLTIQYAIDQVKARGGVVCLCSGVYHLREAPIDMSGCTSVRLTGAGAATVIAYAGATAAIRIQRASDIVVENLSVLAYGGGVEGGAFAPNVAIALQGCMGVVVRDCVLVQIAPKSDLPAIGVSLASSLAGIEISHNLIYSGVGLGVARAIQPAAATTTAEVVDVGGTNAAVVTFACQVSENLFWCRQEGINLTGALTFHIGPMAFSANAIVGCERFGLAANGTVINGSLTVINNIVRVTGVGIAVGSDDAVVDSNTIAALVPGTGKTGIIVGPPGVPNPLDRLRISNNSITGMGGDGILISEGTRLASATIRDNIIQAVHGGGILCGPGVAADVLEIVSNQLLDVAAQSNNKSEPVRGISITSAQQVNIRGNTILRLGAQAVQSPSRTAIEVLGESVCIAGNTVLGLAPREYVQEAVGIRLLAPFDRAQIRDNTIRQAPLGTEKAAPANWCAIRVGAAVEVVGNPPPASSAESLRSGTERRRTRGSASAQVTASAPFSHVALAATKPQPMMVVIGPLVAFVDIHGMLHIDPKVILAIRGNTIDCSTRGSAVDVHTRGMLSFGDNQCLQTENTPKPAVYLQADAMIVTSNWVNAPGDISLDLHPATNETVIVLGNISHAGAILVNSHNLKNLNLPANISA